MEFVTFEIAKRLKEKGFRMPCIAHYNSLAGNVLSFNITVGNIRGSNVKCLNNQSNIYADAPTISQVLKWLREEKKIHIQILFACPPSKWEYIIVEMTNNELRETYTSFKSYEQAALAGIEYVLDNLILLM